MIVEPDDGGNIQDGHRTPRICSGIYVHEWLSSKLHYLLR
jgi:hypothetical protein